MVLGGFTVVAVFVALAPLGGSDRNTIFSAGAVGAMLIGLLGLRGMSREQRRAWGPVLLGYAGWVVGDLVWGVEKYGLRLDYYPLPSDLLYLVAYIPLGIGINRVVTRYRPGQELAGLLDAAIIATGAGILAVVFVVAPLAAASEAALAAKLVSAFYPMGNLMLLAMLVRLVGMGLPRQAAFRLLVLSVVATLVADGSWFYSMVEDREPAAWADGLWLVCYISAAAAVRVAGPIEEADDVPLHDRETRGPRRRVIVLAAGLVLPAVALLADGLVDGTVMWPVVGVGSLLLSALVLVRMAGLLGVVEVQAVALEALARSDALTGAPNRRTWDHELDRAASLARETGASLTVAMIDLDRFKDYNDTYGHQAGDLLLKEVASAWREQIDGSSLLARYGGEEFAILFLGTSTEDAARAVHALRDLMPEGQTFSAGVAEWDPGSDPTTAVARADEAMYEAKRSGRDRVIIAAGQQETRPTPTIVLQPIVSLDTGREIAVEALSRFPDQTPAEAFAQAHSEGRGHELEADAIRAALMHRRNGRLLSINVSLTSLTSSAVAQVLPEDLGGIVLEITEFKDAHDTPALHRLLADLRERGAWIAIDDLGSGFSNLDRVLRLMPEMIKLDMSLISDLDSPYHRAMIRAVTGWADEVGATICAEGVETERQLAVLRTIGVHAGQGHLLGHPEAPDELARRRSMRATNRTGLIS